MLRATHAAVVLAALITGGCCDLARFVCPCPTPRCPATSRQTPGEVVDLLSDAFRNSRIGDIYDTFHPEFKAQNGGFTQDEFAVAYAKWKDDFAADAETLAGATRAFSELRKGVVLVELTDARTDAYLPVVLENRPRLRVVTGNAFVGTVEGPVDVHALVTLKDGKLSLPPEFDLTKVTDLPPEAAKQLTSADILSVQLTDYWMVRDIDPNRCRNIRFLDKLKEYLAK